jgi:hypothetical protein
MKFKLIIFILIILVVAGTGVFFIGTKENEDSFEKNREKVLSQLYLAIEKAEAEGKYKCCIEPPCTMCYLGDWVWEDGTCDCDGMIAMGEWDKVCPQCIKGIKEGKCKSEIGTCPIL